VALKIKTGKLAWYHQEVPHDLWDYGADSPVMLFNLNRHGSTVPALAEAGKDGHVYVLNAQTGKQLFAPRAYVKQGHPAPTTKGTLVCPGSVGGSPYSPLALDPEQSAAYVSGINLCQVLKVEPTVISGEKAFAGVRSTPDNENPTGTFDAINLKTGGLLWKRKMSTPMVGGAAATAGNLVFTGDQHGNFYALNAATGKTLWKANVGLAFGSAPIVYTVGSTEYVAAAVGGSATTAANHLGPTGARLVVFKLGGKGIAAARP
jgi:glucose dehydrogenase